MPLVRLMGPSPAPSFGDQERDLRADLFYQIVNSPTSFCVSLAVQLFFGLRLAILGPLDFVVS